jgi:NitT/TauT family transport system substrate-binding protein
VGVTLGAVALKGVSVWGDQALPTLRLSLAPQIDSLTLAFGNSKGIFKDNGINIDLQGIGKRSDRNTAFFTGQLDGVLSDISSILLILNAGAQIRITSTAYESIDGNPAVEMLASPFSNAKDLAGLLQKTDGSQPHSIGIMPWSDLELEIDALIQATGFTVDKARYYSEFEDLTLLAQLVGGGSILGAMLPEPMGTYLQKLNPPALLISDFHDQKVLPSIIAFQEAILEKRTNDLEKFYQGYRQAIAGVNASPKDVLVTIGVDTALSLFLPGFNLKDVPTDVVNQLTIPKFPDPRALQASELQRVSDWAVQQGYLPTGISYDAAVSTQFVPH